MGVTLRKTSCSPIFNEGNDYSCAIFDAAASSSATASSSRSTSARCRSRSATRSSAFADEGFEPGDACCSTTPTTGLAPAGRDDRVADLRRRAARRLRANRAHHLDVGGTAPGSFYADATENYQEGLRITPIKLFRAGELDARLLELVLNNCRLPDQMRMDLRARCRPTARRSTRVQELVERYGARRRSRRRWTPSSTRPSGGCAT